MLSVPYRQHIGFKPCVCLGTYIGTQTQNKQTANQIDDSKKAPINDPAHAQINKSNVQNICRHACAV